MKNMKVCGEYVLIEFVKMKDELKKTKGGILLPEVGVENKAKHEARIRTVGPLVDLKKWGFKIGDKVVYGDYDMQKFGDENDLLLGVTRPDNIKVVYED